MENVDLMEAGENCADFFCIGMPAIAALPFAPIWPAASLLDLAHGLMWLMVTGRVLRNGFAKVVASHERGGKAGNRCAAERA